MSSSANAPGSFPRLGPTWYRGSGGQPRGFQPPPAVPVDRRSRSGSYASSDSESKPSNVNKFSALDDDEDLPKEESQQGRSPFRSSSFGPRSPQAPKGRTLADLAKQVPEASIGRSHSTAGRFSSLRSDSNVSDSGSSGKVIRFTREKLLALRPKPAVNDEGPPENLRHLEGIPILSDTALDPVCWDSFDADEIWAQAARERSVGRSSSLLMPKGTGGLRAMAEADERRRSAGPGTGKWQRGVALPPQEDGNHRGSRRQDAENPNDLWDDPLASTGAAADFSAFGTIPDDPKYQGNSGAADAFDFKKVAEASSKFGEALRRGSKTSSDGEDNGDKNHSSFSVDPERPLASAGTTIMSGSGDHVNVFEDFDDEPSEPLPVKAADQDASASSRLMKMIGVEPKEPILDVPKDEKEPSDDPSLNPWAAPAEQAAVQVKEETPSQSAEPAPADVPINPWGNPVVPQGQTQQQGVGFDLAARLGMGTTEQSSLDEIKMRQAQEDDLRRRQEEEAQRRARQEAIAQKQAEEQARQMAIQQQGGHSQVELILLERISNVLENSWGRADLVSVLSTLHAEDSRVVPLLGSTDALRALIARHPRRVALRPDPAFGVDMAVLLLTNTQFQQQQQQAQARAQQELQFRDQQMRMQAMQQGIPNGGAPKPPVSVPDAPWFYSDPQKNIQGPFRGEEMRQWLEAGYFKGDLPVSQQAGGPFVPLSVIFPDLSLAFRARSPEARVEDKGNAMLQLEPSNVKMEEELAPADDVPSIAHDSPPENPAVSTSGREIEDKQETQTEDSMTRERLEMEAAAKAAADGAAMAQATNLSVDQNESSAQLKMILGLGAPERSETEEESSYPKPIATTKAKSAKAPKPRVEPVRVESNSQPEKPVPTAWGGASSSAGPRKSMSEIQQEEARASALKAMERQTTGRSASAGWANIAASGSNAWSNGAVKPNNSGVQPNLAPSSVQRAPKPQNAHRQSSAPPSVQRSVSAHKPADEFGTSMSTALESWCREQMTKLNGSDDLTLVAFCMTLTDPVEIRQYLTAYLGSTPQVGNFATEFINRRGLGKVKQEKWESTKPKKGRKKGGK